MSQPITLKELDDAPKHSKKNSFLGPSGFTYNWWRKFWSPMQYLLLLVTQLAYDNNKLPTSQAYGMISLLPKEDKDLII